MTDNHKGMLMLIAAVVGGLMVLMLIAVFASVCHGQVLWQVPIEYDKDQRKLNPVAVDADLRELLRWVRYCRDNVDTLMAESDTVSARVDTVELDIDTLHARVDSNDTEIAALETNRDSVFFAYDSDGGTISSDHGTRWLVADTEIKDDFAIQADGDSVLIITSAGDYFVWYDVTANSSSALSDTVPLPVIGTELYKASGDDWAIVAGSARVIMVCSCGGSVSAQVVTTLAVGDSLRVLITNNDTDEDLYFYSSGAYDGCSWGLAKLH